MNGCGWRASVNSKKPITKGSMENIQTVINLCLLFVAMGLMWRSNRLISSYRKHVEDHRKALELKSPISIPRPKLGEPSDDPTLHDYMVKNFGPYYYFTAEQREERWNRLFRFKRSVRKLKKVERKRRPKPFPSYR